jgi:PEP-CTERM motif
MKLQKIAAIVFLMGAGGMIQGQAQVVISPTSGDAGGGLTLLANSAGAVSFASGIPSSLTIQGITFTSDSSSVSGSNQGNYNGGFKGNSLGGDANDTALASLLEGAEYSANTYTSELDTSATYEFSGLTAGQTYQLDVFTTASDSTPRNDTINVVGSTDTGIFTDNIPNVNAQLVEYDLTPDASGDITINWGWNGDLTGGAQSNSGIINALALTYSTASVPEPSSVLLMSVGFCVLLAVGLKRRVA